MKKISNFVTAIFVIALIGGISSGCTKVIDLNLNTANPVIVIEGNVTSQPGPYTVLLSQTASYYDTSAEPAVTGAVVTITDNGGPADTLKEVSPGTYLTKTTQGVQGHTYALTVVSAGKKYQATSTMPDTVSIAYLSFVVPNTGGFGNANQGFRVHCHFKDPAGIANYYRALLTFSDTVRNSSGDLTVYRDNLSDGDSVDLSLRGEYVLPGDTVNVQLFSIDQNNYNYLNVLRSVISAGGPNSTSTPQNPPTNLSNGAIGYFSASSVTSKTQIVP